MENFSIQDLMRCVNFAAVKHKNQRRKDQEQTPYINHPIGVAYILTEEAGITDFNVIQAAVLHDTVEDTDTTIEEIRDMFGDDVAGLVAEVTDDKTLEWKECKRRQIVNAVGSSPRAKQVKLADKLYNLRDLKRQTPRKWTGKRVQDYFLWSARVVKGLRGTNQALEASLDELFKERGVYEESC